MEHIFQLTWIKCFPFACLFFWLLKDGNNNSEQEFELIPVFGTNFETLLIVGSYWVENNSYIKKSIFTKIDNRKHIARMKNSRSCSRRIFLNREQTIYLCNVMLSIICYLQNLPKTPFAQNCLNTNSEKI